MKRDVLKEAKTPYLLNQIDVQKEENHLPMDSLDLGSEVASELTKLGVSNTVKLQFKKDCKKVLLKLCEKLAERSPLNYLAVRNAISFDP